MVSLEEGADDMTMDFVGCWTLRSCRSVTETGHVSYPFGHNPSGLLIYTPDNRMAVQIGAAGRGPIGADDPLSPSAGVEQRATAFSTYLAYYGYYQVESGLLIHEVQTSLFPDWSGQKQVRAFTVDRDTLTLTRDAGEAMVELVWVRVGSWRDASA
jgi:Lipocalin-like domain